MRNPTLIKLLVPMVIITINTTSTYGQNVDQIKRGFIEKYEALEYDMASSLGEQLMALEPNMGNDTASVHLLYYIAYSFYAQENYQKAQPIFSDVEQKLIALGEKDIFLAYTYYNLGFCFSNMKKWGVATDNFKKAIELYKTLPDKNDEGLVNMLFDYTINYLELRRPYYAKAPYEEAMRIIENNPNIDIFDCTYKLTYIAEGFYKSLDYHYARRVFERALPMYKQLPDRDDTELAYMQIELAYCYYISHNLINAIISYEQALSVIDSIPQSDDLWKADVLNSLGRCYYSYLSLENHYDLALKYYFQALDIYDNHFKDNTSLLLRKNHKIYLAYTDLLYNIGECYNSMGDHEKYIKYSAMITSLDENGSQREQDDNYTITQLLTDYSYFRMGQIENIPNRSTHFKIMYGNFVFDENATNSDENNAIVYKLYRLAYFLLSEQHLNESKEIFSYILEKYRCNERLKDDIFSETLLGLGMCYFVQKDYLKAVEPYSEALEIYSKTIGQNAPELKDNWFTLGQCYFYQNMPDKAIEPYSNALRCYENDSQLNADEKNDKISDINTLLAKCYLRTGNYDKSIEYFLASLNYYYEEEDIDGANVWEVLTGLAYCFFQKNNLELALSLSHQLPHDSYKLEYLHVLGRLYYKQKDYDKTSVLYLEAVDIFKRTKTPGPHSFSIFSLLSDVAKIYTIEKNYSKVEELLIANIKEIDNVDNNDDSEMTHVSIFLFNVAKSYALMGKTTEANNLYTQLAERLDSIKYGYLILPYVYLETHDYSKALSTYMLSIDRSHNTMLNEMKTYFISRNYYWDSNSIEFLILYPNFVFLSGDSSAVGDLYNKSALFSKGIILTIENEFRDIILNSGDSESISKYNKYQENKTRIAQLKQAQIKTKEINDELRFLYDENRELERVLSKTAMIFGDYMENLQLTWEQVRDTLGTEDIAIEFLSFPKFDTDSIIYIALTVRKGYSSPHMTVLCDESQLKAAAQAAYTDTALSKLIWGKLASELEDVKNIYFSPSGELHNIAIESMPHWDGSGSMMSDSSAFNIYRLSSTRELALKRTPVESSGAALYGGINYSAPVEAMGTPRQGNHGSVRVVADLPTADVASDQAHPGYRVVTLDDGTRGLFWSNLDASVEEVGEIGSLLSARGTNVGLWYDNNDNGLITKTSNDLELIKGATETSFKNLSEQKLRLIHIATHGFYWTDSTAKKQTLKPLNFIPFNYNDMRADDKSMVRAGLLFTGAQNTFSHKSLDDGIDDGVLTAQEVADLDLRGVDLVVLSACQTGLGEVTGDGVFGLQRGFKKAGAQSIIMSLWKVNDYATRDMMTEFYRAYTSGKSKRASFLAAQQHVKDHDGEYTYSNDEDLDQKLRKTQPHWAAFILLDALEKQ